MQLVIRVIQFQGRPPNEPAEAVFSESGGTIGRNPANDWQIPDPMRFVSGRHARLSFSGGQFYITDLSSNGVFVNRSLEPLGRGNSCVVDDGDRLAIGEFELAVEVIGAVRTAAEESPLMEPPAGEKLLRPGARVNSIDAATGVSPLELYPPPASHAEGRPQPSALHQPVSPHREAFEPPPIPGEPTVRESGPASAPAIPEEWARDKAIPEEWDRDKASPQPRPADAGSSLTRQGMDPFGSSSDFDFAGETVHTDDLGGLRDSPQSESASVALQAFLEAAEISDAQLATRDPVTMMRTIGLLMRDSVAGLADLMRARSEFKELVRAERTHYWRADNPLKNLALAPHEALSRLLLADAGSHAEADKQSRAFVAEVTTDLKMHELAIIAAMQATLQSLVARFNPANFEDKLREQGGLSQVIPGGRKAGAWELYAQAYAAMEDELEEGMTNLLRNEFGPAYEREIQFRRGSGTGSDVQRSDGEPGS